MGKERLAILICLAALLILVISLSRTCRSEQAITTEAQWICLDCGHVYTFTQAALEEHYRDHYGEPLSCPECDGLNVQPATECPNCGQAFSEPGRGNTCPHCNEALPAEDPPE